MKAKRILPIVLSLLMAGAAFAGCSDNNTADNGKEDESVGGITDEETPGTDTPGEETPDKPGTDTPGEETPDNPGTDTPGNDGEETFVSTPLPADSRIYVVGDSTVCSFSDNYYLPRYGYGTQLAEYLNVSSSQIVNLAMSGRSSKSFLTESNYNTLTSSIKSGDYLIIGFGHNDEKSAESARFTDPNGSKDEETTAKGTSFKWCLYENYIKVATEAGATPILCTPIVRYDASGNYTGSKAHVTTDGDYPEAIKELGEETETTVIDLTALTKQLYTADNANAIYYHAHTTYFTASDNDIKAANAYDGTETPDGRDDTHINKFGAKAVAYLFADALKSTDCSLKQHVKDGITAPAKENDYFDAVLQTYVKVPYPGFDTSDEDNAQYKLLTTTTGETTVDWYKTAMGALGGASKVANYTFTENNGTVKIIADAGSKFAATQDGFGAVFVQVDVSKNFKASAKVTVTAAPTAANAQNAFGMMLRDDILINTNNTSWATNFVAAGLNGKGQALFSRNDMTALSYTESKNMTFATGVGYEISVERTGQTVVTSIKQGSTVYTATYTDFDFVSVDNDYMYLCLFANRGITAEFSDITFEITGESQGA